MLHVIVIAGNGNGNGVMGIEMSAKMGMVMRYWTGNGMGMGMIPREWEGMGTRIVIPGRYTRMAWLAHPNLDPKPNPNPNPNPNPTNPSYLTVFYKLRFLHLSPITL